MRFPFYRQIDYKDCGPTCLKIVAKFYGKSISLDYLRNISETTRAGSSLLGLSDAFEQIGFRTLAAQIDVNKLREIPLPAIIHWNNDHYVVLYKIKGNTFYLSDPAFGLIKYNKKEFISNWIGKNANENTAEGVALLVEPTPSFFQLEDKEKRTGLNLSFLLNYFEPYKRFIWQLIFGLIASSAVQLVFPFITQGIVDIGIKNQNIQFVYLMLFAQLALFLGRTAVEVIRRWLLLHLSVRINISLVSDFLIKLMKLPISFFDTRLTGDILQRIEDHKRIEQVMTSSSLMVLFSMVNLIVFSLVLLVYDYLLYSIYIFASLLYVGWILFFLKKRRVLEHKRFSELSQEQSKIIELITGMQEIKLLNAEKQKRWGWEYIQASLFQVSLKSLALEQYQDVGSAMINEAKNILITVLAAKLVIDGEITLGMMLAISYIVGQLNAPLLQLVDFIREVQDAKISLERLVEIHDKEDETAENNNTSVTPIDFKSIKITDLSFRYLGSEKSVLHNVSVEIPQNKTTAIVGRSGSGKTTLMKLLLKFYEPNSGTISVGKHDLNNITHRDWREKCGVVMQDGFIFNDTIARNIAVGVEKIDKERLAYAIEVANIKNYIETLPLSYNTKIGMEGMGMSMGQRQRILIARAVYKQAEILFFDEATSALDANNELEIIKNLNSFFKDKTVIVIAHRLSTVKSADQIIVIDEGKLIEKGTHQQLLKKKGAYFELVKNQLEL